MTTLPMSDHNFFDQRPSSALMLMLTVFVALFFVTIALPANRYIRYQQLNTTVYGRSRWDYERIHFDRTPIDVAVVGDSRTEAAISAPNLETTLSEAVGRPVHVANFSILQGGRNLDYVIVKELLANRPEVKIILLGEWFATLRSHPAFKFLADAPDLITSPMFVNYYYLEDLCTLPYRSLKLFFYSLAPSFTGFSSSFDQRHYQGTYYDTTRSYYEPDGSFIDRKLLRSAAELDLTRQKNFPPEKEKVTFGSRLFGKHENVIEDVFDKRIAKLAASRGVELIFIHIPDWREHAFEFDVAKIKKIAPLIAAPATIATHPGNYGDSEHLNFNGIEVVRAWLAPALHPFLGPLMGTSGKIPLRHSEPTTALKEPSQ